MHLSHVHNLNNNFKFDKKKEFKKKEKRWKNDINVYQIRVFVSLASFQRKIDRCFTIKNEILAAILSISGCIYFDGTY